MGATPSSPTIESLEMSLRHRLRELRGEHSLRDWADLLYERAGYGQREKDRPIAPNTIRSYEPDEARSIPVDYILAVGVATNRNPFWILTGQGPKEWGGAGDGPGGAVLAAAQVMENVVSALRTGAFPPTLAERSLPPGPAREIGEALETLLRHAPTQRHGAGD